MKLNEIVHFHAKIHSVVSTNPLVEQLQTPAGARRTVCRLRRCFKLLHKDESLVDSRDDSNVRLTRTSVCTHADILRSKSLPCLATATIAIAHNNTPAVELWTLKATKHEM